MPARWEGKDIVVLDAVVVAAPYRGEDCKGVGGAQAGMVGRVRKVVSALFLFSLRVVTPEPGADGFFLPSHSSRTSVSASQTARGKWSCPLYPQCRLWPQEGLGKGVENSTTCATWAWAFERWTGLERTEGRCYLETLMAWVCT